MKLTAEYAIENFIKMSKFKNKSWDKIEVKIAELFIFLSLSKEDKIKFYDFINENKDLFSDNVIECLDSLVYFNTSEWDVRSYARENQIFSKEVFRNLNILVDHKMGYLFKEFNNLFRGYIQGITKIGNLSTIKVERRDETGKFVYLNSEDVIVEYNSLEECLFTFLSPSLGFTIEEMYRKDSLKRTLFN